MQIKRRCKATTINNNLSIYLYKISKIGGATRDRTADLLNAISLLSLHVKILKMSAKPSQSHF